MRVVSVVGFKLVFGKLRHLPVLITATLLLLPYSVSLAGSVTDDLLRLDQQFARLSTEVYRENNTTPRFSNLNALRQHISRLAAQDNTYAAVRILHANSTLLETNIYEGIVQYFADILLAENDLEFLQLLYDAAINDGDPYAVARLSYRLAQYNYDRYQWQSALDYLENVHRNLGLPYAHHALLLGGSSLQHLKKHRESVKLYEQIPADSPFYTYARLNIAIAYIRQDWWTDARITINEVLKLQHEEKIPEIVNRLYLVLGYLLLHKEYYRDAREAFRNIALDSRYLNRALLGLGLAAASETDFVGALNALLTLKQKDTGGLEIDESYVLLPYVYEKLNQSMTASAGYNECTRHTKEYINAIDTLLHNHPYSKDIEFSPGDQSVLRLGNTAISVDDKIPAFLLRNIKNLRLFKRHINSSGLQTKIGALLQQHLQLYGRIIDDELKQRKQYLQSYMNQCRLGTAKLFDKNEAAN